jgi:aryl-alcohol dehydrogenase
MKVIAAVAREANQPFSLEELEMQSPGADEVIVAIKGVGLCHTDITSKDFPLPPSLPAVLGHEGAGIVEEVGSNVSHLKAGDRVVISFASCGGCHNCHDDLPGYCDNFLMLNQTGQRIDGSTGLRHGDERISSHFFGQSSFASHALTDARNCIKIDDPELPIHLLGPLACGIQTGAGTVIKALDAKAGGSLLVLGGGTVGLSSVMAGAMIGLTNITVVEPMASRRELAISLGASQCIDPINQDLSACLKEVYTSGVDYIVDSTARSEIIETAIIHLALRGKMALLGFPPDPERVIALPIFQLMAKGQSVIGAIEGDVNPHEFIPYMLNLYKQGKFPFTKLITLYHLSEINQAVKDQHEGVCVKPVMVLGSEHE